MNALQFITNTNRYNARNRAPQSSLTLLAVAALSLSGAAAADPVKGTLTATGKVAATVNVKHAYLVKGLTPLVTRRFAC